MIFLKTSNGSFFNNSPWSDTLSNKFYNKDSTSFWYLTNWKFLFNYLERIFKILDLNYLFMCRIKILKINGLINVRVGIFKIILFHVNLIDLKFDLFNVFSSYSENDIILRFKEFLSFLCNYGDLFGFF